MENLISVLKLVMENEDVKKSCYKPLLLFISCALVYVSKNQSAQIQINLSVFENSQTHPGQLGYALLKSNSSMQRTAINE